MRARAAPLSQPPRAQSMARRAEPISAKNGSESLNGPAQEIARRQLKRTRQLDHCLKLRIAAV